jgi:hypothetical protein
MVPMYKKGGKASKKKSSFMEESKEITFGNKPMKKGYGGMKYKKGGFPDLTGDGKVTQADVLKGRGVDMKKSGGLYSAAEKSENVARLNKMHGMEGTKKKTGGKSMEPGGGGRFAKMVEGFKKKGKSEDSAKAIAASIGRKKYGKSKFQEMAAKGKKGLGGMSDSTSSNDAGMEMMENMEAMGPKKPKKKKGSSGTRYTGPNAKRAKKAQKRVQSGRGGCNRGEVCFD